MDSQFFGRLVAEHLEGKWWRLTEPLAFYSARFHLTICAPAGFVTDFASVPRLPLAWLIAGGTGHWEAVIHDVPYRFGRPSRSMADQIFYEAGRVRNRMRKNQHWLYRSGRLVRTGLMTGAVTLLGGINHSPLPGCLDYRKEKWCARTCDICGYHCHTWHDCIRFGYMPEILDKYRKGES